MEKCAFFTFSVKVKSKKTQINSQDTSINWLFALIKLLQKFILDSCNCGWRVVIILFRNSLLQQFDETRLASCELTYFPTKQKSLDAWSRERRSAILKMISASLSIGLDNSDPCNLCRLLWNERGSHIFGRWSFLRK